MSSFLAAHWTFAFTGKARQAEFPTLDTRNSQLDTASLLALNPLRVSASPAKWPTAVGRNELGELHVRSGDDVTRVLCDRVELPVSLNASPAGLRPDILLSRHGGFKHWVRCLAALDDLLVRMRRTLS